MLYISLPSGIMRDPNNDSQGRCKLAINIAAGLKHRSQVRSGHRSGQVNRKNIFLPRR